MKSTKGNYLKKLASEHFKGSASTCTFVHCGSTYTTDGIVLVIESTPSKADTKMQALEGTRLLKLPNKEVLLPENRIFSESSIDPIRFNNISAGGFIPVGDVFVDVETSEEIKLKFKPKITVYRFPVMVRKVTVDSSVYIGTSPNGAPVLRLVKNEVQMLMPLSAGSVPTSITFNYHGMRITPTHWVDSKYAYKELKKENNMSKLPGIPGLDKVIAEKGLPAVDDLETAEQAEAMLAEIAADEEKKKEEAQVETPAVESKPAEEPQADVPPVEEPKKKRIRKPKAAGIDLTDTIEAVSATIPDDMTNEDVLKEIRQLRDLIKVSICRLTNLSVATIEKTSKASSMLDSLKAALGKL